jgi:hypothetical protein
MVGFESESESGRALWRGFWTVRARRIKVSKCASMRIWRETTNLPSRLLALRILPRPLLLLQQRANEHQPPIRNRARRSQPFECRQRVVDLGSHRFRFRRGRLDLFKQFERDAENGDAEMVLFGVRVSGWVCKRRRAGEEDGRGRSRYGCRGSERLRGGSRERRRRRGGARSYMLLPQKELEYRHLCQ